MCAPRVTAPAQPGNAPLPAAQGHKATGILLSAFPPIPRPERCWTPIERKTPPRFLERPVWSLGEPEAHPEALPVRSLFSRREAPRSRPAGLLLRSPRAAAGPLRRTVSGAGGVGRERPWRGRDRPRVGRARPPFGDPSLVRPAVAPRPTTSETRLSPPGGLAGWRLDTNLPGGQACPESRTAWALEADETGCHVWEYGKDIKREVLHRDSVVSGAGGRFEFDQRSCDRTVANLAYTQVKRVLRAFLPGRIWLVKERRILQK